MPHKIPHAKAILWLTFMAFTIKQMARQQTGAPLHLGFNPRVMLFF
jgi:hypothetical protein